MERLFVILAVTALAQPLAGQTVTGIVAEPERVQVTAGQSVPIVGRAIGADGQTVDAPLRIAGTRRGVRVANGQVTGIAAGEYEIFVASISTDGGAPIQLRIPVTVGWPAVEEVVVLAEPGRLFAGTRILHRASASHADGTARPYPEVTWSSSDESVATVDPFGNVRGVSVGSVTITASVDGITGSLIHEVEDSPVTRLELRGGQIQVRTGDVQSFDAAAYDAQG